MSAIRPRHLLPVATLLGGLVTAGAAAQQFDEPYNFTPRESRVAIAIGIYQVEHGLLGPGDTYIDQSQMVCNAPDGSAQATGNSVCNLIRGNDNVGGTQDQDNSGNPTSTANNTTAAGNGSVVDSIAAALAGNY